MNQPPNITLAGHGNNVWLFALGVKCTFAYHGSVIKVALTGFGKVDETLYTLGGFDKLGVEARIMVKTVTLNADIPASRELRITLPADVPTGSAAIVITVSPTSASTSATCDDLLNSEFLGMWSDRTDIVDSLEFARKLRSES
jgi:hypothetical protein